MTTSPPVAGQLSWATPLDNYINNNAVIPAAQALGLINTHISTVDPHGDQAYARSLVNAITSTANQPNGFAQLNAQGKLPLDAVPLSALQTNFYDAVNDYGIIPNTGADLSSSLQAVLNQCATAGGGEVWVGDGVFSLGSTLIVGSNTWLHLSPGCVMRRINPVSGSAPPRMLCNVSFAGGYTPSGSNILVSGGTWDATGAGTLTSACTPIVFVQVSFVKVENAAVNTVAASPAVEINGSSTMTVRDCYFTGPNVSAATGLPAIRLNSTSTSTTPNVAGNQLAAGAYNNAVCTNVIVDSCVVNGAAYNLAVGVDQFATGFPHNNVTVTACEMGSSTYTQTPPVDGTHVNQLQVFGNQFYGDNTLDLTATGTAGSSPSVFVGNSYNGGPNLNGYIAGSWQYATGVQGAVTPETWHTLPAPSIGSIGGVARYKLLADSGLVLVQIQNLVLPGTSPADGTVLWAAGTLPAGYQPSIAMRLHAVGNIEGTEQTAFEFETTGAIEIFGAGTATRLDGSFLLSTI